MKKVGLFILVGLGLLILNHFGFLNWLKGGLSRVFGWRNKVYSSLIGKNCCRECPREFPTLDQRLSKCQAKLVKLEDENQQARRLLGTKTKPETKFELAKIISMGDQKMILSLESFGLVNESASVVSGPFLVGKVNDVFGKSAKVKLLISSQTKLPVKIWPDQNLSNAESEIIGEGILTSDGQNLYVEEILDSQPVEEGNWVGAVVESGDVFWVGKVKEVFPSEDKIFQKVRVSWAVDLTKLITVGVIKSEARPPSTSEFRDSSL